MAQVVISINDREYPIACENGQEARILQLAGILQQKADMLKGFNGKISEAMMLAMIGILVADDLFEARKNQPVPQVLPNTFDEGILDRLDGLQEQIKNIANLVDSL